MHERHVKSMRCVPGSHPAHGTRRRRLERLAPLLSISLALSACGTAGLSTSPSARAVPATVAADAATPVAPPPTASPDGGPAGSEAPAATEGPTPAPSGRALVRGAELTFTSLRHGYGVTTNANDWLVNETPGTWDGTFDPHRFNPDPGTDWLRDPGVATIEIGVLDVAPGTTLAAWEASEAPAVRMLDCKEVPPAQPATAAGARLLLLPEACPKVVIGENAGNQYFLNAFLVHGTSGLVIQWNSVQGHEAADRASFFRILATWTWIDR